MPIIDKAFVKTLMEGLVVYNNIYYGFIRIYDGNSLEAFCGGQSFAHKIF